ncbi:MAG: alpha/beta hydrolase [bacterium]|nr:alpha/beta hydrolase [bacterium]
MVRTFMRILVLLVVLVGATGSQAQESGTTFVLVHGAFQDAAGWNPVIAELEARGHTALTVQLPGRDAEGDLSGITLQAYRDAVIEVVEAQQSPVVLVAHSFGGMVITATAEAIPDQIAALVYVAAYLPATGDSLASLAAQDRFSLLGQEGNFLLAEDFSYAYVNPEIFASAFCPDCDAEQAAGVIGLREPLGPLNEPASVTADNFGAVRKAYILTAQDVVVSPQLQAQMLAATPVESVYALNTGHAPYVTQPEALAALLIQSAADGS